MKRDIRHVPVLLEQVLEILAPAPGQVIVDCTLGLGGHSTAILERIKPDGLLIGIDFDPQVVQAMAALPIALTEPVPSEEAAAADRPASRALVQFPTRPSTHTAQPAAVALRKAE